MQINRGEQPRLGDYDEKEIMAKSHVIFIPKWVDINDLTDLRLLPDEVKTVVLQDIGNNFRENRKIKVDSDQEMKNARESFSSIK